MKPATTNNQTGQQNALPKKKRSKRSNARKNRDKKDKKILSTSNITVRTVPAPIKGAASIQFFFAK